MSALGHKQTFRDVRPMSALPPKADIGSTCQDVRFVPIADIALLRAFSALGEGQKIRKLQRSRATQRSCADYSPPSLGGLILYLAHHW
jgi:hypothetical protein